MALPWCWSPSRRPDHMLRIGLFLLGLAALVAGLAFIASGGPLPVVIWLLGFGLVLTLGVAYERVHYKSLAAHRPGHRLGENRGALHRSRDGEASHRLFPNRQWRADVCRGVSCRRAAASCTRALVCVDLKPRSIRPSFLQCGDIAGKSRSLRRHPGESRDPGATGRVLATRPWTPAFAGVTARK